MVVVLLLLPLLLLLPWVALLHHLLPLHLWEALPLHHHFLPLQALVAAVALLCLPLASLVTLY
jgi:hypothetical protein